MEFSERESDGGNPVERWWLLVSRMGKIEEGLGLVTNSAFKDSYVAASSANHCI